MLEIDNHEILKAARSVPCIEVLETEAPEAAKRFAGPYYPDEGEKLVRMLKAMRSRESVLVAIGDGGLVNIYRRAKA